MLEANHISVADALEKIPATGPKGRLLKGDVLVYLGTTSVESINKLNKVIEEREHLDLSNIKIAEKKAVAKEANEQPKEKKPEKPKIVVNFDELLTFNPPRREFSFLFLFFSFVVMAFLFTNFICSYCQNSHPTSSGC